MDRTHGAKEHHATHTRPKASQRDSDLSYGLKREKAITERILLSYKKVILLIAERISKARIFSILQFLTEQYHVDSNAFLYNGYYDVTIDVSVMTHLYINLGDYLASKHETIRSSRTIHLYLFLQLHLNSLSLLLSRSTIQTVFDPI